MLPPPQGRRRNPVGVFARLLLFVLVAGLAGVLVAAAFLPLVGGLGVTVRSAVTGFEELPDQLSTPPLPQRSVILAADGSLLATLYYQNRVEVPLTSVAPIMRQALVAIEDSRFLEHRGIDLRGTMRALATNTTAGGVQQGGSTLTMQYVKNVLVNNADNAEEVAAARARTPIRKLREIRYALALERRFTKDQILERYINIVYFGAGAYGVEAASRRYFSKPASKLTLPEAATLAGIVQQPTAYDPTRNPRLSTVRRDVVLRRMAEVGFITQAQAARAAAVPMKKILKPKRVRNGCTSSYAPFFCDYVVRILQSDPAFGETTAAREALLKRGGLTIRTTLQPQTQDAAYQAAITQIPIKDDSRRAAAIAMVQPGTGQILAMAQNRKWGTSGRGRTTYNYVVDQAYGGTIGMQAGSTFKVFTLAAALEAGVSPFEPISSPSPKTFEDFVNCETGAPFGPITFRNSTGQGTFDMRKATAYSINTYFVALEERTGLCRPAEIAEKMGVRLATGGDLYRVPSFTLGTMEISPLSLAGAYAAFANHGEYCRPIAILQVSDRTGKRLPIPSAKCKQVVEPEIADTVTSLLTGVIDGNISGRTGQAMSLGRPAAGKTGTTNDSAAVWFAGYTPELAAAVWVGDPRGGYAYPMKNVVINGVYYGQVFGSTMPGPIWKNAMLGALAGTPEQDFQLTSTWGLGAATDAEKYGNPLEASPGPSESGDPSESASASPTTAEPTRDPTPTAAPQPKPTSSSPRPTTSAPAPKPTSSAPAPKPTSSAPAPKPTSSAPAPQPTSAAPAPKPTSAAPQSQAPPPPASPAG
ncbi:MAG: transglycosylase domain-containing protein [Candidatus Nanopelagicales bacterium]